MMRILRKPSRRRPGRHYGLVGVISVLALLAAVVISYRANSGLPFQSSYQVFVDVPNANRLNHYADVRIGGIRVGQVQTVSAMPGKGGARPFTRLELALSPSVGRIAADSTVQIRSASVLGATYVDLTPGKGARKLAPGGTLGLSQVASTVQLTDLLDVFDRATARSIRTVLGGLGDGLAARGENFNATIASVAGLAQPLTRVLGAIAAPRAQLASFLRGYEATVGALAPVAAQFGQLVADASTTLGALNSARAGLGQTIDTLPPAESATTTALVHLQPALSALARLTLELRPGADLLPSTLPALNATLTAGVAPLRSLPQFASQLQTTLQVLNAVSLDPAASGALRSLTDAVGAVKTLLDVLTPAQLQCNILGVYGQNFPSVLAGTGFAGAPLIQVGVTTRGANNEEFQNSSPSSNMHVNANPHENYKECEAGNEPYNPNVQLLANPPGLQSNQTEATSPPPGVRALAARAGLLNAPAGTP
jgi:virulence factor Mce-like protein